MSSQSELSGSGQRGPANGAPAAELLPAYMATEEIAAPSVSTPLVFRSLADGAMKAILGESTKAADWRRWDDHALFDARGEQDYGANGANSEAAREAAAKEAANAARADGIRHGEREGHRKARQEMEAEMHATLTRERQRLLGVVAEFAHARERYFASVEQEVVKLALAIAARVLHREAQMDELLLAGAVRVALEKMADRSGVVLRAAQADVTAWEAMFGTTDLARRPQIVGDQTLAPGECALDTKMGTVELGVKAQLGEIERGFFDLLNHRPGQEEAR